MSYTECWVHWTIHETQPVYSENSCHFPFMSYSHEKRYQTLLDFLYCKRRKAGQGLGTRLQKMGVHFRVEVLHTTLCDTTSLSVPLIVCSYLEHLCNQVTVPWRSGWGSQIDHWSMYCTTCMMTLAKVNHPYNSIACQTINTWEHVCPR